MIKNGLRVGDSDLFVTSTGTTVKGLTVGNVNIPSTIGSDNQVLKVVSGSLAFANAAGMEDSDLSKVATLQNKVDDLIARVDSDSTPSVLYNGTTPKLSARSGGVTVTGNIQFNETHGSDSHTQIFSETSSAQTNLVIQAGDDASADNEDSIRLRHKNYNQLDPKELDLAVFKRNVTNNKKADITFNGDLTLQDDDSDADHDPTLTFYRNSATPADNDALGHLIFKGKNSAGEDVQYGVVSVDIKDVTDGTESGSLRFEVMKDGSAQSFMTMNGEANQIYMNKKFNMQGNNINNINNLTFEGSTDDANETTLSVTNPTTDRTVTIPDADGDIVLNESGAVNISSTADNGPQINLKSNDHADAGAFHTEGSINFFADNDANEETLYGQILIATGDPSDGAEDGWIYIYNTINGSSVVNAGFGNGNLVLHDDDAQIEFWQQGGTSHSIKIAAATPSATRTLTLPDETGTLATREYILANQDSDQTKVANLQNKVDGLINRLDSDDDARQIGTLVVDSDGQILLNTNDDVANSGTLTIDSDGQILFLTGNDTLDSVGNAILSLRADRDSDSSKLGKISEVINRLDSDSTAIQSLATKTRADLDSDSIIIQQLRTAVNTNTANIASSGGIDSDHVFQSITVENNEASVNLLSLQTTDDSNTAGPELNLNRVSSSPADADYLGQIKFRGKHDGGGTINYAKMTAKIDDATQATSSGILEFMVRKSGSNNINARLHADKLRLFNDTRLDIDFNTSSQTGITVNDTASGNLGAFMSFNSGGTQRATIQNANNGGMHVNVNGGSLSFGNAGYDAINALDDYEEGTWTPAFSSTGASFSYGTRSGEYVKIGRVVYVSFRIQLGSGAPSGTTSNTTFLTGLPFAIDSTSHYAGSHVGHYFNLNKTDTDEEPVYQQQPGATQFEIKMCGDLQGESNLTPAQMQAYFELRSAVTYLAGS